MATGAQMRKLALALPEVEERSHLGSLTFACAGWTYAKLAKAKPPELRFLLEQSWRLVAPKKLVAAHDAQPAEH